MYKYGRLVLNNAYVFVNMRCTTVLYNMYNMAIKYALYYLFVNNKILQYSIYYLQIYSSATKN